MARSAIQYTKNAIGSVKAKTTQITVSPTSTTSNIYKLINPIATAAAVVAQRAEQVLFSRSWGGAQGKYLDNLAKEINVKRLPKETDDSFRRNAPRIFSPGATLDTSIGIDDDEDFNDQLTKIEPTTQDRLFTQMKSRFFRLQGATDLPLIMPRYWMAVAYRLREFMTYIVELTKDWTTEDSEDIANTDWIYRFDALRVPGVRDAKVEITGYNEITIWVYVSERLGYDRRRVEYVFDENAIMSQVKDLAMEHAPKADLRTLQAPTIRVRPAAKKPFYMNAVYSGSATYDEIRVLVEDWVYGRNRIGTALDPGELSIYVRQNANVTTFTMNNPVEEDMTPGDYEVIEPGFINLTNLSYTVEAYNDYGGDANEFEIRAYLDDAASQGLVVFWSDATQNVLTADFDDQRLSHGDYTVGSFD